MSGTVLDVGVKQEIGTHGTYLHGVFYKANRFNRKITVIIIMIVTITSSDIYCKEEGGPVSSMYNLHGTTESYA